MVDGMEVITARTAFNWKKKRAIQVLFLPLHGERSKKKGQYSTHSHLCTLLALVLQTQQQGQKWTKMLWELPYLSLSPSINISQLGKAKTASGFMWDFSTGLSSHVRSEKLWWFVSLNMFSVHFPFNDAEERDVSTKEDVSCQPALLWFLAAARLMFGAA